MRRAQPTHADIQARLEKGQERFGMVERKLDQIIETQVALGKQIEQVKVTADATKDVVEAWNTARNMGKFVKWAAGVTAALSAILVALSVAAKHIMR